MLQDQDIRGIARGLGLTVGVAAAYFLVARASLFLAVPVGGFASPVWPAAGIALGALVLRPGLWPGVVVGSALANLPATGHDLVGLVGAVLIGCGAAAQAGLGAALVRRLDDWPSLVAPRTVAWFFVLGGPLACLVNSTTSVLALSLLGLQEPSRWLGTWATWWVGDLFGVMTFAPLVLALAGSPDRWRGRRAGVVLTLLGSFTLITLSLANFHHPQFDHAPLAWVVVVVLGLALASAAGPLALVVSGRQLAFEVLLAERTRDLHTREAELQEAKRLETVGRLAGRVAHDFNNLLTIVLASADLASHDLSPEDPAQEDLHSIREAGLQAASLTEQLLTFSRQQLHRPEVVALDECLRTARPLLERLVGPEIELRYELAEDLAPVHMDPRQLERVLINLAANARDAMAEGGGALTVRTRGVDGTNSVRLAVEDTGAGMDEETRAACLEPFFTTKSRGQGTGLGLATVYGIVQQSQGQVRITSQPGQGTVVELTLPAAAEALAADPDSSKEANVQLDQRTVLLVEDEECVRRAVEGILSHLGLRVLTASGQEEAVEFARNHPGPIDLLLTDVMLKDHTGPMVVEALRALRADLRVLYMSGHASQALGERGVLGPEVAFLPKPFTADTLAEKVRRVLEDPTPPTPLPSARAG
jgi:signal transduction histidine kinase/CheY-like chemotaxis protein